MAGQEMHKNLASENTGRAQRAAKDGKCALRMERLDGLLIPSLSVIFAAGRFEDSDFVASRVIMGLGFDNIFLMSQRACQHRLSLHSQSWENAL